MQATYADVKTYIGAGSADRAPGLPLLGFLIGTGLGSLLWLLIGSIMWLLLR